MATVHRFLANHRFRIAAMFMLAVGVAPVRDALGASPTGPVYQYLRAGEVKPEGWLKEQMLLDLHEGIAGHFPDVSNNVNRRTFELKNRQPDVPVQSERGKEKSWWAGEHEGYWKDGVVRMAFLTEDKEFTAKARQWVEAIVAAQDSDGYIGIYDKETRFPAIQKVDGELWTQSRIFQAMLAYYEFTGDAKVLDAVEKAVNLTLVKYKDTYFRRPGKGDGGVGHGIGLLDTLDQLYRLTGKRVYRDGIVWLCNDYCLAHPNDDFSVDCLLDANRLWQMHTPHIMEGLSLPQVLYSLTGDKKFQEAAKNALVKLSWHTTPGGAVVGDENVARRKGTGSTLGEYCSYTEGTIAMNRILAYCGDLTTGNWVEHVCLNAAQGARLHAANRGVAYLSRDDRQTIANTKEHGGRVMYSACHKAAACCILQSIRLPGYYVEGMWYRPTAEPGLVANLYGACRVETQIADTPVRIDEKTAYPFEDAVTFAIAPARPVEFALILRTPEGARDVAVDAGTDAKVTRSPGQIEVRKLWKSGDSVALRFDFDVRLRETNDKQFYYQRGPLVYALKFPEKMEEIRKFELNGRDSGFREFKTTPIDDKGWNYRVDKGAAFTLMRVDGGDSRYPWVQPPLALQGTMRTPDGKPVDVKLVPEGSTVLRRATFPAATTNEGG